MLLFHFLNLRDERNVLRDGRTVSFRSPDAALPGTPVNRQPGGSMNPRAAVLWLVLLLMASAGIAGEGAPVIHGPWSCGLIAARVLMTALLLECYSCHFITDILYHRLTDRVNAVLFTVSILLRLLTEQGVPAGVGWDMFFGSIIPAVLMLWMNGIKPGSFGLGDVKFCLSAGPILGLAASMEAWLAGLHAAGAYGAVLLVFRRAKKEERFALGPFLIAGYLWMLTM